MTAIEESQTRFMAIAEHVQTIRCPNSDYEPCYHPACGCHCAPIKEEAFKEPESWPPIRFAGDEPRTQDEHAEHLEMTRPQRTPADFRKLLSYGAVLALCWLLVVAFMAAVMPQVFASVFTN